MSLANLHDLLARGRVLSAQKMLLTDEGYLLGVGAAKPTDAASDGYAPGAYFFDTTNGVVYQNEGTKTSNAFITRAPGTQLTDDQVLSFGDALDVSAKWDGSKLLIIPVANDTGSIQVGNGTLDIDVKVLLGATTKYILFDVGNSRLQLEDVDQLFGDNDAIIFGDGSDVQELWNATYLQKGPATGLWAGVPFGALFDHAVYHMYFEDFVRQWAAADWDIVTVEAGGGDAAEAIADGVGGVLTITNDAADDDYDSITFKTESFKLATGKKLWFEARCKISDATQSDFIVGLIAHEDLSAVADNRPADGVVFHKEDGDTHIDFTSAKDGTDDDADEEGTMDTDYHVYGFYFDGAGTITPYIDGTVGTVLETTICEDEELAPFVGIRNGEAVAKIAYVDYIKVVQLR